MKPSGMGTPQGARTTKAKNPVVHAGLRNQGTQPAPTTRQQLQLQKFLNKHMPASVPS